MIRLRTKLEVIGLVCLFICSAFVGVGITRTISDTQDTLYTMIQNSKGNCWTATGANLQLAIWDLNSTGGGRVDIPACNISISNAITTIDNLTISGSGRNTILYLTAGHNARMGIITTYDDFVVIENILFDSNNDSQTYTFISGVDLDAGTTYSVVRNCWFINNVFAGVHSRLSTTVHHNTVEGCCVLDRQREGYGGGIVMRGSYNIVRNNYIKDTYATGITTEGDEAAHDNIIDSNYITGDITIGIYSEITSARNNTIVNNCIYNLFGTVAPYTPCAILTSGNNIIVNNRIFHPPVATGRGIYCKPDDEMTSEVGGYVIITGNYVDGANSSAAQGIIVDVFNGKLLDNAIISNNVVKRIPTTACIEVKAHNCIITSNIITESATDGIECDYANTLSVIISNNHLLNITGNAINLAGVENITIEGNIIYNETIVANSGIYLNNVKNVTVIGNRVLGYTYGIREAGTSNCNIISMNNCLGNTNPIKKIGAKTVCEHNLGTVS